MLKKKAIIPLKFLIGIIIAIGLILVSAGIISDLIKGFIGTPINYKAGNAVSYNNEIYFFYQLIKGKRNSIYYGREKNQFSDTIKVTEGKNPAAVNFSNKIYLFYIVDKTVSYKIYDANSWSEAEKVEKLTTTGGLSPVLYNSDLYLFYSLEYEKDKYQVAYSKLNEQFKNVYLVTEEGRNSVQPAAVIHDKVLHLFYREGTKIVHRFLGQEPLWSPREEIRPGAKPSASSYGDNLVVAYSWAGGEGDVSGIYLKSDQDDFSKESLITHEKVNSYEPTLFVKDDSLYLFYVVMLVVDKRYNLHYDIFDKKADKWSGPEKIYVKSDAQES